MALQIKCKYDKEREKKEEKKRERETKSYKLISKILKIFEL
jgi:hypothetical protein